IIVTVALLVAAPAFGASQKDQDACDNASGDVAIASSTRVINDRNERPRDRAGAYLNRGNAWSDKGDNDRAIADYSEAIRRKPKNASAYFNRGIAWSDKGDNDRAIADYSEAIRLNPVKAKAYFNRGIAWSDKGDNDRAIAD